MRQDGSPPDASEGRVLNDDELSRFATVERTIFDMRQDTAETTVALIGLDRKSGLVGDLRELKTDFKAAVSKLDQRLLLLETERAQKQGRRTLLLGAWGACSAAAGVAFSRAWDYWTAVRGR